jgi:hypothetical protein
MAGSIAFDEYILDPSGFVSPVIAALIPSENDYH